jgi:hypothetical protein
VDWVRRLTVVLLATPAAAPAAHAATIPVTTTADGVANDGGAAGVTVIDTLRGDRAFDVLQGSSLALEALTVLWGRSAPGGPGGAIRNQGTLTIVRSSFEGNATGDGADPPEPGGAGGAIWSGGPANPSVC